MTDETPATHSDGLAVGSDGCQINWATTLAAHDRWLRTAVLARLNERQAVDEVMQDVALAAVARQLPFYEPARVGAWLYRIAVRQALLHRRRNGRHERLIGKYQATRGEECGVSAAPDPLGWLLLDERRDLVRQAIASLSRRDREILLLKYTENWSYRDLAAHLGVSESAIEARLHRARQRLRAAMIGTHAIEVSE